MADSDIPEALRPEIPLTAEERQTLQLEFERRAHDSYYAEWFWFPYSDRVWINTWDNVEDSQDVEDYPGKLGIFLQLAETFLMQILQDATILLKLAAIFPQAQTTILCKHYHRS